jgi:ABC-type lipoprotein export system ATPase subunit
MDITLRKVCKRYRRTDKEALRVEDLTLRGGFVHGVLGHSGSGKSTMLNLLSRLDRADRNEDSSLTFYAQGIGQPGVTVHPAARDQNDDEWRRDYCSFVFQSGFLLENFTVLDNVLMPLRLRGDDGATARERAKAQLSRLGLESDKWRALPRHLSGGEYQRAAVARAIVHGPEVLFADEPTGSLDPGRGKEVMQALLDWKNERPKSNLLVLVTHNVDYVRKYCDVVTVLRGGLVILHGTRAELNNFHDIGDSMSE